MKLFSFLFLQNLNFLEICHMLDIHSKILDVFWQMLQINPLLFNMYELPYFCETIEILLLWILHKSDLKKELFGCHSFKQPQRTSGFQEKTGGSLGGHLTFSEKGGGGVRTGLPDIKTWADDFLITMGTVYTCNTLMASTQIILF